MSDEITVYLGLGGNVGDVAGAMRSALKRIGNAEGCRVAAISPVYRTPPWGPVEQDWYLNACARIESELSPSKMLDLVLETERALGRVRDMRWGPRTLDIDILLYGDESVATDDLTIPHPRMSERAFVMVPLADIAPDRIIAGFPAREFAAAFAADGLQRTEIKLD